jgi:hypothetical protein
MTPATAINARTGKGRARIRILFPENRFPEKIEHRAHARSGGFSEYIMRANVIPLNAFARHLPDPHDD